MQAAHNQFSTNIQYIRELESLYLFLKNDQKLPNDLSDLLRAQIVYAVSALDKLVHDLVRIGMIESFKGSRVKTKAFLGFTLSADTLEKIKTTLIERTINQNKPPQSPEDLPEYWFEKQVILKHKSESYQEPSKLKNALSLIWNEDHKWQKIAQLMQMNEKDLTQELSNIVLRRNQIVHEADISFQTNQRNPILFDDVKITVDFIQKLGDTIYHCVK